MSMLSLQVDGLREMAVKLGVNGVCTGDLSELCVMLREAADTIESMRDRLQAAELGSGTCEFKPFADEDWSEPNAVRGVCSECSALMYGKDNYCPNCGKRVVE